MIMEDHITNNDARRLVSGLVDSLKTPEAFDKAADGLKGLRMLQSDSLAIGMSPTDPNAPHARVVRTAIDMLLRSMVPGAIAIPTAYDGEIMLNEFIWFVSCCKCGDQYGVDEVPHTIYDKYHSRADAIDKTNFETTLDAHLDLFGAYCEDNYKIGDK